MPLRSARLGFLCVVVLTQACTYDWDVGPAPASSDAGQDAAPEVSGTCQGIIDELDARRPAATQCLELMVGVACTEIGTDECGCVIGGVNPNAFDDYEALVQEFHDEGCSRSCGACPPSSVEPMCTADPGGGLPHCE